MALVATLIPTSTTHNDGALVGAATAHEALNTSNGDTSYVQFGTDPNYVQVGIQDMPTALSVDSVQVALVYKFPGAVTAQKLRIFVVSGGVTYYGSYQSSTSSTYTTISEVWTVNPSGSVAWTNAAVNALEIGVEYSDSSGESIRITYLFAEVSYTPMPASVDVSRHLAAVDLFLKKRPEVFATIQTNLDALAVPILGVFDVEHTAGPHATGLGYEDEVWQRRPFAVHGIDIDQNAYKVTERIKDQRPIRCLVRDLAWSEKASGVLRDGIATFSTPGSTWSFTRASEHTFTNPVGESETVPVDVPAYGSGGLYMLSASGGRAAPRYYVTNNTGERTLSASQGSFQCEVNLAAVSAVANQTVAYCYHDASNWWWLYWDPVTATDRWVFEIRAGGSTYRAIKETTPSSATWYQIGARWTGANTENGDAAYTMSIFIDRVKGTDAVAGAAMTEASSSNFDFGSKAAAGTDQLNGQIRKIHSYQDVLTDTEMQRTI